MPENNKPVPPAAERRSIRVFVSSTFSDMVEDRNELMTQAWPELRRYCRERQVELVEVDLRWGIAEEQATRKETLKLCLDEIRACRPFFIGLLGERYGWTPGAEAFTADLQEEQPWIRGLAGKSVTELEILHGVLNSPEMAGRSFIYFRDPAYAQAHGAGFLSENAEAVAQQDTLKKIIRHACAENHIPLHEDYANPSALAKLVLEELKAAIEAQFPIEDIPDPLTREARDHEAFAETRRRTYIGRPSYFKRLDDHTKGNGGPLVLVGDSGSGKSALVANWIKHWRQAHPHDFIFQHYIGGTPDSADHWRLMARLVGEIKRWSNDPEDVPRGHDDLLRDFTLWLAKARSKAEHDGVRCIVVLDALNQLDEHDRARLLGWLPEHPFTGGLRLLVSTLPGETMEAVKQRGWETLRVEPLTTDERRQMIEHYLARFAKKLDAARLDRLAAVPAAANPLYLKILLDELRVTGTHDRLDERLNDYLKAKDIPALLKKVLERYQHDYERDRPRLVSEALGLIWAARRGLSENELLHLLKPADQERLPLAIWSPLRAALEEGLVDRGGILNFAHEFLRSAVEAAFVPNEERRNALRLQLADEFEQQPISARSCDELPLLLSQTKQNARLRTCLLDIDRFLEIFARDQEELRRYWVELGEARTMGGPYLASFEEWSKRLALDDLRISPTANRLAVFLHTAALLVEAEPLMRRALAIDERTIGLEHPDFAVNLNNLAELLRETDRLDEAEPLMRRALAILEKTLGLNHPHVAIGLNSLAHMLQTTNRLAEAEPLMRRALVIDEKRFGPDHAIVANRLNNLAHLLQATNRMAEAEPLMCRALAIDERSYGPDHPDVARDLNNIAQLYQITNRLAEAEPLMRRALEIDEQSFGPDHPNFAIRLNNLAGLLQATNRLAEAEPLYRRALEIDEQSFGPDHPEVAKRLNNLAALLRATNRLDEAEPLYSHALEIDELSYGPDHPDVATDLNNIAQLFQVTNRLAEAEPLMRRVNSIFEKSYGENHPKVALSLNNLAELLRETDRPAEAEPLMRRALAIEEQSFGPDHPDVATYLNNMALILQATDRLDEAELLIRRVISILEKSLGINHPNVAAAINNLARLLQDMNRLVEAEPLMRRTVEIFLNFSRATGHPHPHLQDAVNNYAELLDAMGRSREQIMATLREMAPELF